MSASVGTSNGHPPNARVAHGVQLLVVALAPLAVFFAYRIQPMPRVDTIDPTLYTAYLQNGPEVLARFGADQYYWTRLGLTLPGRASYLLFGPVGGFYAFRYALALVAVLPAFELFRRLRGPAAGAVAVAVILVNPVILRIWGTDYPSSAAIAYLVGGSACLLMPSASTRARWAWIVTAAALFTLAMLCHVVAIVLVAGTIAAYAVVYCWAARRRMLIELAVIASAGLATTVVCLIASKLMFDVVDIVRPNVDAARDVQGGFKNAFHSTNWRWILRDTHLFVIPLVLVASLVLFVRRKSSSSREAKVASLAMLLQAVAFTVWQFGGDGSTLETYLYFSFLWAGVAFLAAFVLVLMWDPNGSAPRYGATAAAVLVIPWAFHLAGWEPQFGFWPWVPVLVVGFALVAYLVARPPWRDRRFAFATTAVVVVAFVAISFTLTIGQRTDAAVLVNQIDHPEPYYGEVLFNPDHRFVDYYRVASRVPDRVPTAEDEPGRLLIWFPDDYSSLVEMAAAMYLRTYSGAIGLGFDRATLDDPPRLVMLLGDDASEFGAMTDILRAEGFTVEERFDRTLTAGDATLHQRLLEVMPAPVPAAP